MCTATQDVNWAKRLLTLEVFDWDFWRPDTVLGRAFIDVNLLSFEPEEVSALCAGGRFICVQSTSASVFCQNVMCISQCK